MDYRIMQPTTKARFRLSTCFSGTDSPVNPFTGKPIQPPRGMNNTLRKEFIRKYTHMDLKQ